MNIAMLSTTSNLTLQSIEQVNNFVEFQRTIMSLENTVIIFLCQISTKFLYKN